MHSGHATFWKKILYFVNVKDLQFVHNFIFDSNFRRLSGIMRLLLPDSSDDWTENETLHQDEGGKVEKV